MREMSGREILLRQQQELRQVIIDCSLAMRPAWEAAIRDVVANYSGMQKGIGLDTFHQINANQAGSQIAPASFD